MFPAFYVLRESIAMAFLAKVAKTVLMKSGIVSKQVRYTHTFSCGVTKQTRRTIWGSVVVAARRQSQPA